MDTERETFYQEYLSQKGTLVKPFYWLSTSQNCTECPYHIQTGEEARVPYVAFHRAFGFPYGPIRHQNKHLLFYELRHSSGNLIQKGHATNCTDYNIHPESMLFGLGGYLDSVVQICENAAYIVIYSNYTPCNEAEHGCISKIYSFLTKYPDITLCIYFSQLYHTEEDFPVSTWNCEALRSLASMWPQVILSPLCGGLWHSVLYNFVTALPRATSYHPILPARALMDRKNVQRINNITGIKFPFMNTLPQPIYGNPTVVPNLQKYYLSSLHTPHPTQMMNSRLPPLRMPSLPPSHLTPLVNVLPPFGRQPLYSKPKNVVKHLKMPDESLNEAKRLQVIPNGRSFHEERIIEQLSGSKTAAHKRHRKKEY